MVAEAKKSATGSAAYSPITLPLSQGSRTARGTSRMILRSRARNRLVLAWPRAIKVD